jgi:viroplasmin and RNaseH domain-containing protein
VPAGANSNARHPFHLSATELNYNAKESTWELSCRIFTDDLESVLSKNFKVKTDLSSASQHKAMDVLVKKYALANLNLKGNSKPILLNYLGFEKDNEAVIVYLESEPVKGLQALEATNSILYDLFDDQSNIIHITKDGSRKSSKLDYPEKKVVLNLGK